MALLGAGAIGRTFLATVVGMAGYVTVAGQQLPPTVELRYGIRTGLDAVNLRLAEAHHEHASGLGRHLRRVARLRRRPVREWRLPCRHPRAPDAGARRWPTGRSPAKSSAISGQGWRRSLVYVPRVVELSSDDPGSGRDARSHPALATLDVGHLIGLTIAHEVGHGLGLKHASAGVMKARPSLNEVIALRTSTLVFRENEAARMRLTLLAPPDGQLVRRR